MKHIAFLSLCVLLVVVSATPSASFHSKPTPDREIPKEAEAVLHKLKQSCSTKCVDGNYQIKIDSGKGNMNEVICKDFCKFIFFAFKKNQDELFSLAKSGNLNAIVKNTYFLKMIFDVFLNLVIGLCYGRYDGSQIWKQ